MVHEVRKSIVVVWGGTGFLGRYIIQCLANEGYIIRVAVRNAQKAQYLCSYGRVGQISIYPADVEDMDHVRTVLRGADGVVNAIGIIRERRNQKFSSILYELAKKIALVARDERAKHLVYISALGADKNSDSVYLKMKAFGEEASLENFQSSTVIRPGLLAGSEDKFFNRLASLSTILPVMPLLNNDDNVLFQPVYVGDVANAVSHALLNPDCFGETYELGGIKSYTYRGMVELVLRTINRRRLLWAAPQFLLSGGARFLGVLPFPLLTQEQLKLCNRGNVISGDYKGFVDLGISPSDIEILMPKWMRRFKASGQELASREDKYTRHQKESE